MTFVVLEIVIDHFEIFLSVMLRRIGEEECGKKKEKRKPREANGKAFPASAGAINFPESPGAVTGLVGSKATNPQQCGNRCAHYASGIMIQLSI